MRGWSLRSELRCTLDRIKMNPIFRPVPRLIFKIAAPIRSLYIERARSRCTVDTEFLALTTS